MASQNKDQPRPQLRKASKPIQNIRGQYLRINQRCSCTMKLVIAPVHIAEAIGALDGPVPRVPDLPIFQLDVYIDDNFA